MSRVIRIYTDDEGEKMELGKKIHEQLRGNQDYIDSNIVLNIDESCVVKLDIFEECENVPEIKI